MLSTSYKFSKKDTSSKCADTKQICVLLPFPYDLILTFKNIYTYIYIYISTHTHIYIYIYTGVL